MGAPASVLARYESEATPDDEHDDSLDDEEESEEPGKPRRKPLVIEVLECNWLAAEVFRRCQLSWVSGMRAVCLGISAEEIRSAAAMLRIGRSEWMPLIDDVQLMGRVAASVLNQQKSKT